VILNAGKLYRGWLGGCLLRPEGAKRQGEELGAHEPRQGLLPGVPGRSLSRRWNNDVGRGTA
jgi:hypothetical protein